MKTQILATLMVLPLVGGFSSASAPNTAQNGDSAFQLELAQALDDILPMVSAQAPKYRTIDGSKNNLDNPAWGRANSFLLRLTKPAYADGISKPARPDNQSARVISNILVAQTQSIPSPVPVSDFVWQWGQFIDHDLDLSPHQDPLEPFFIKVPKGDPFFDPNGTGDKTIELFRSQHTLLTPFAQLVRQQVNVITAYVDASNVFGSDLVLAKELREGVGGRLEMDGDLLPEDPDNPGFFLAGDVRSNEQVALTAMHTLFVREHNTIAGTIELLAPWLDDETIYQIARMIVWAEIESITYNEFLPALLGPKGLSPYTGYDKKVNAGIGNFFATASYRFGHSMLSPTLLRLDENLEEIPAGHLPLRDAFFAPDQIRKYGIEPVLRGLANQVPQRVDTKIVDAVRNFLFDGTPENGGFDLASLNIQRGRDHGVPDYNGARKSFGLKPVSSFKEITSDPKLAELLAKAFKTVDDIDPWVGGLAEDPVKGALVGELIFTVLGDQFERLRDGDRFFYEDFLPPVLVWFVRQQTLSRIIRRNTDIGSELQSDVFHVVKT